MRISENALTDYLSQLSHIQTENQGFTLKMALDLRDMKEAVKILQDRLRDAEEKNKALQLLSDSQAEALNLMEMGRL